MSIEDLRAGWERLGTRDPLWAVLTDPAKRGGQWTKEEFLAAGDDEIGTVFERLLQVGALPIGGRALDFGCGAGRLTQALAKRFDRADGVDIAEAMLGAARRLDPPLAVVFHHNATPTLALFEANRFDFVYSSIVLQHMESELALGYICEFVRVTKTGGLIVFQAPEALSSPRRTARRQLQAARVRLALGTRLRGGNPEHDTQRAADFVTLQAHTTPEALIIRTLEAVGTDVLDIAVTNSLDEDFNGQLCYTDRPPSTGWVSKQYTARVR